MTTETKPRHSYKKSQLLPPLMATVKCCTPQDVLDWSQHAPLSFEHKTSLSRAFCNDCEPAFRQMMLARSRCMTKELNGAGFEPVVDEGDFA